MNEQREKLVELICDSACEGNEEFGNCPERRLGKCRSIHELEMCQVNALADQILADEEIKHAFELLKAEKEGRLLETPCKEGDTVFCIWQYSDFTGEEDPFIEEATAVSFVLDGSVKVIPSGYSDKVNSWYRLIDICFSREDAEKALKTLNQPCTNLTPTDTPTEKDVTDTNVGDMGKPMDKMREKLIELIQNAPRKDTVYGDIKLDKPVQTVQTIADHLLANGVIVPPCKVGDKVWFIDLKYSEEEECELPFIMEGKVETFSVQREGLDAWCFYNNGLFTWHNVEKDLGVDWFLSREDAEKALKGVE